MEELDVALHRAGDCTVDLSRALSPKHTANTWSRYWWGCLGAIWHWTAKGAQQKMGSMSPSLGVKKFDLVTQAPGKNTQQRPEADIEPKNGGRRQWLLTVANRELLRQFQTGLRVVYWAVQPYPPLVPPDKGN